MRVPSSMRKLSLVLRVRINTWTLPVSALRHPVGECTDES
jgi:hypothetical protein